MTATREPRSGLRVLIIGINYRPELTGIGPYTAALAEQLAACNSLPDGEIRPKPHRGSQRCG